MRRWLKVREAAALAGGISPKLIYLAIQRGELKAARIGAGRNLLTSDVWIDEWLTASAEHSTRVTSIRPVRRGDAA